jgi:signal transduction histidine kinase
MQIKKRYLVLPVLVVLFGFTYYSVYKEVKNKTIKEFNVQQMLLAKQAAKIIEKNFTHYFHDLAYLSKTADIADLNKNGKKLMDSFYSSSFDEIRAITRISKNGRIIYTAPFNQKAIGADVSYQEHNRLIMKNQQPIVSDVFTAVQGYQAVACLMPIFANDEYQGVLTLLVPFDTLAKEFLKNITIGKGGYAWVISQKGRVLYCPVPGHAGKSVIDLHGKSASFVSMTRKMLNQKTGTATYTDNKITKHAAYYPLQLGSTFWSIVVSTPEKEVLATMTGFKNRFSLIAILLTLFVSVYSYYIMKASTIVKEEQKRRQTEEDLRKSEKKIARLKKMESIGLMAGGIAHDLNNILSGIVSYPDLILMQLPADSPIRKHVKAIQESGLRAADIVSDLLTVARGIAVNKKTLSVNTIVSEYLISPEHHKLEKMYPDINFKAQLDFNLFNIDASPAHMKKTLMNLVLNASQAIVGDGNITISASNQFLEGSLKLYADIHKGNYVLLAVSDDGAGISPADLERIFEPFYTKKIMGRSGTGLGLTVVWNTMLDHNGYINVKSDNGGTTFELYFPATDKQLTVAGKDISINNLCGNGEKILVVDDEKIQREIACALLTQLNYTAESVSSGEAAIKRIKNNAFDLIVLDMIMPNGLNGLETYKKIIKIRPGQKAIIASGYAETEDIKTAQQLGAGKYIKKPYTIEKIGLAIKEALSQ